MDLSNFNPSINKILLKAGEAKIGSGLILLIQLCRFGNVNALSRNSFIKFLLSAYLPKNSKLGPAMSIKSRNN